MEAYGALFALFITVGVGAAPTVNFDNPETCANYCSGRSNKFNYEPGTNYIYSYKVKTETVWPSVTETSAKMDIDATVHIQAGENCEYLLVLKDVCIQHSTPDQDELQHADREAEFKEALETNPLRFGFDDGIIDVVCPDPSEGDWPLNFKKAVLSVFQNTLTDFDRDTQTVQEVDINGDCSTDYTVVDGLSTSITKTKELNSCSRRGHLVSKNQFTQYDIDSDVQTNPMLKNSFLCEFDVSSEQVLTSATCREEQRSLPFEFENSGATTIISQTLTFQSTEQASGVFPPVQRKENLLYNHKDKQREETLETANAIIHELFLTTKDGIRPETPRLVAELTQVLKGLDFSDLSILNEEIDIGASSPLNMKVTRLFKSTLEHVRTEASVRLIAQIVQNENTPKKFALKLIQSLAYTKGVNEAMVEAVVPLLEGTYRAEAKLPVSVIARQYCKANSHCHNNAFIEQICTSFTEPIGLTCAVTDENLMEILTSLRSLGNIGQTANTEPLAACMNNKDAPLEVQVSAAEAYRSAACPHEGEKDDALWAVMEDTEIDIEVRISAYISIMRCPTKSTIVQISEFLWTAAEDDLLATFIYSYLTSIETSSDPYKKNIAEIISHLHLRKFPLDSFAKSRHREFSFMINKMNTGATVDLNLIMAPNAPVPRAATANITLNGFGNSINVIDWGIRAEGLETAWKDIMEKGTIDLNKAGRASVYLRMFGNELSYRHKNDGERFFSESDRPSVEKLLGMLAKQNKFDYINSRNIIDLSYVYPTTAGIPLTIKANSTASVDFQYEGKADFTQERKNVDASVHFSTAMEVTGNIGLDALVTELGLRTRGTIQSNTGVTAKLDLLRFHLLDIEVEAPRDGMEIFQAQADFYINFNGQDVKQDVVKDKKAMKLCTSEFGALITGAQLCGELGYTHFNVKLNKRDTQTKYFLKTQMNIDKENQKFSLDVEADSVGSQIDRHVQLAANFEGDNTTGTMESSIKIDAPWRKIDHNGTAQWGDGGKVLKVTTETLVNETDLYLGEIDFVIDRKEDEGRTIITSHAVAKYKDMVVREMWGELDLNPSERMIWNASSTGFDGQSRSIYAALVHTPTERSFQFQMTRGDGKSYQISVVKAEDKRRGETGGRYEDMHREIIFKTPSMNFLTLDMSSQYSYKKPNRTYAGDFNLAVLETKPINFEWDLKNIKDKKGKVNRDIKLKLKSAVLSGNFDLHGYRSKQGHASVRIKTFYNVPQVHKNSVTWITRFNDNSKNENLKYTLKSNFENRMYPDYNFDLDSHLEILGINRGMGFVLKYGSDHSLENKTVDFNINVKRYFKEKSQHRDVEVVVDFKLPEKGMDFHVEGTVHKTPTVLEAHGKLKLIPFVENEIGVGYEFHDKTQKLILRDGNAYVKIGEQKYALAGTLHQKSFTHFIQYVKAELPGDRIYDITVDLRAPGEYKREMYGTFLLHGFKPLGITFKASVDPENTYITLLTQNGEDAYGGSVSHRFKPGEFSKWHIEAEHPERKVDLRIHVRRDAENTYDVGFTGNWDVRNQNPVKSTVAFDSRLYYDFSKESRYIDTLITLKTPWEPYSDSVFSAKVTNNQEKYDGLIKVSWMANKGKVSLKTLMKRPITPYSIYVHTSAHTTFKRYKHVELLIDHSISKDILTTLRTTLDNTTVEAEVKAENLTTESATNMNALVDLKTPLPRLKRMKVTAEFMNEEGHYDVKTRLNHNDKIYNFNTDFDVEFLGKDSFSSGGEWQFSNPMDTLDGIWFGNWERTTGVKGNATATWLNSKQRVEMFLNGTRVLEGENENIFMDIRVNTPDSEEYKFSDITVHRLRTNNTIDVTTKIFREGSDASDTDFSLSWQQSEAGRGAKLSVTPSRLYEHPISTGVDITYGPGPISYVTWLQVNEDARIDVDGTIGYKSMEDFEFSSKFTTPFENFTTINIQGSNKKEGDELVTSANLVYGVGKHIKFDRTWLGNNVTSMWRVKFDAPSRPLNDVDSGFRFDRTENGFSLSADVKALPIIDRHDLELTWESDGVDRSANIIFNTPEEKPFLKSYATNRDNQDSTRSLHLVVEPRQHGQFVIDSDYHFEQMFSLIGVELDVNITTPFENFTSNRFVIVRHGEIDESFDRHFEVQIGERRAVCKMLRTNTENSKSLAVNGAIESPLFGEAAVNLDIGAFKNSEGEMTPSHVNVSAAFSDLFKLGFGRKREENKIHGKLVSGGQFLPELEQSIFYSDEFFGYIPAEFGLASSLSNENGTVFDIALSRHHVGEEHSANIATGGRCLPGLAMSLDYTNTYDFDGYLPDNFETSHTFYAEDEPFFDVGFSREHRGEEAHGKLNVGGSALPADVRCKLDYNGEFAGFIPDDFAWSGEMVKEDAVLLNVSFCRKHIGEEAHGQITTKGELVPEVKLKMDYNGTFEKFLPDELALSAMAWEEGELLMDLGFERRHYGQEAHGTLKTSGSLFPDLRMNLDYVGTFEGFLPDDFKAQTEAFDGEDILYDVSFSRRHIGEEAHGVFKTGGKLLYETEINVDYIGEFDGFLPDHFAVGAKAFNGSEILGDMSFSRKHDGELAEGRFKTFGTRVYEIDAILDYAVTFDGFLPDITQSLSIKEEDEEYYRIDFSRKKVGDEAHGKLRTSGTEIFEVSMDVDYVGTSDGFLPDDFAVSFNVEEEEELLFAFSFSRKHVGEEAHGRTSIDGSAIPAINMNVDYNGRFEGFLPDDFKVSLQAVKKEITMFNVTFHRLHIGEEAHGRVITSGAYLHETESAIDYKGTWDTLIPDDFKFTTNIKDAENDIEKLDLFFERKHGNGEAHGKLLASGSLIPKIESSVDYLETFEFDGTVPDDLKVSLKLSNEYMDLVDITFWRQHKGEKAHGEVITTGAFLPESKFYLDYSGTFTFENVLPDEFKCNGTVVDENGTLIEFSLDRKNTDGRVHGDFTVNGRYVPQVVLVVDYTKTDSGIGIVAVGNGVWHGVDFDATINAEFTSDWKGAHITSVATGDFENHSKKTTEYTHTLDDEGLFTISSHAKRDDTIWLTVDLSRQLTPTRILTLDVTTPLEGYEIVHLDFNVRENVVDAVLKLSDDQELKITGTQQVDEYPITFNYQVTAPFERAASVDLNIVAQPYNFVYDALVTRADGLKNSIHAEAMMNMEYDATLIFDLNKNLDAVERFFDPYSFGFYRSGNEDEGRKAHIHVNETFAFDLGFFYSHESWFGFESKTLNAEIGWDIPAFAPIFPEVLPLHDWHGKMGYQSDNSKYSGSVAITLQDQEKINMEVQYDLDDKRTMNITFLAPRPMEIVVSRKWEDFSSLRYSGFENVVDFSINWNKTDPSAHVEGGYELKYQAGFRGVEASIKTTISRELRTVTIFDSVTYTAETFSWANTVTWGDDPDQKMSIEFERSNFDSRFRGKESEILFLVGLPFQRTMGFTGSITDDDVVRESRVVYIWDKERKKEFGFTAKIDRGTPTTVDYILEMPLGVTMDMKLKMNDDSDLFDAKVDFSYSSDIRKTLTVVSKVKNLYPSTTATTPGFNYSLEFEMLHPETETDILLKSYIGWIERYLTAAAGVTYQTGPAEMVDTGFVIEIDRPAKDVRIRTFRPGHDWKLDTRLYSQRPFHGMLSLNYDGNDLFTNNIYYDQRTMHTQIDFGPPDNQISYEAFYPNSTAFRATISRVRGADRSQDAEVDIVLPSSRNLCISGAWRPGMVGETVQSVRQHFMMRQQQAPVLRQELRASLFATVSEKVTQIKESISEDTAPLFEEIYADRDMFSAQIESFRESIVNLTESEDLPTRVFGRLSVMARKQFFRRYDALKRMIAKAHAWRMWLRERVVGRFNELRNSEVRARLRGVVAFFFQRRIRNINQWIDFVQSLGGSVTNLLKGPRTALNTIMRPVKLLKNRVENLLYVNLPQAFERGRMMLRARLESRVTAFRELMASTRDAVLPEGYKEAFEGVVHHVVSVIHFWINDQVVAYKVRDVLSKIQADVRDKLFRYGSYLQFLYTNPFEMYDPENGKFEGCFELLWPVRSVDKITSTESHLTGIHWLRERIRGRLQGLMMRGSKPRYGENLTSQPTEVIGSPKQENENMTKK